MPILPAAAPEAPPAAVETVTVTAARLPPAPGDAAFSIIRLGPSALQGQTRLDEALSQVPGVSLFRRTSSAASHPTTQGLSLRSIAGSGAGRALVTLDGVPQNDPFGGWVIWTSLPPEAIESASVVRGAGAGPYGAGALTGVVALDEMSRPGALNLDLSAGGLGQKRAALATAQAAGPMELFVSASGEQDDGWIPVRPPDRGAADDKLELTDKQAAVRFQAPVGPALMALRLGVYSEDRQSGVVGAGSSSSGKTASLTFAAQPGPDQLGWRLQGWVRHSDLSSTFVSVAADRSSTNPANNQFSTPATGWGVNAAVRGDDGRFQWEAGADLREASGEDHENFRNLGAGFTRLRVAGGKTLVAGGYAEGTWITGPWLVTGGARIDGWRTWDGHRIETDTSSGAVTFEDNPADRSGQVVSARLGIKRDLGGGASVRAAAYSGFRPPTLNELYRPFRVGNDITEANAALKPERLYGAEAAFAFDEAAWSFSATGFYNRLDDAVTNVTVGHGPGTVPGFPGAGFVPAGGVLRQRQNAGTVNAWGVETQAAYRLDDRLTLRAAADYTHAEVDGGAAAPQLTGLRPAQTPRFTLTAGADWRATDHLGLHGELRWESSRYDDDENTRLLAGAARLDLRADWSFGHGVSAYAEAQNLTDTAIQTGRTADGVVSYDAPRTFLVGLRLRL